MIVTTTNIAFFWLFGTSNFFTHSCVVVFLKFILPFIQPYSENEYVSCDCISILSSGECTTTDKSKRKLGRSFNRLFGIDLEVDLKFMFLKVF